MNRDEDIIGLQPIELQLQANIGGSFKSSLQVEASTLRPNSTN